MLGRMNGATLSNTHMMLATLFILVCRTLAQSVVRGRTMKITFYHLK